MRIASQAVTIALVLLLSLSTVGCKNMPWSKEKKAKVTPQSTVDASGKTLYDRLGGESALRAVVHDFVGRGAGDPKVNFTRKGHPNQWDPTPANVAKLEERLVEFIGSATGGPQKYKGKAMASAHKGMEITDVEFNALAADLKASLDKFNVPAKEQKELLDIVGSTRGTIVGK